VPHPHYAERIWKRCFPSTLRRRNLKTLISVHTTPEEFENAIIAGHFGFVFEEHSVRETSWSSWRHRFRKASFSKCFLFTIKRKTGVFKFLRFLERFRKATFSWRIGVDGTPEDGRPNRRNKAPTVYCGRRLTPIWRILIELFTKSSLWDKSENLVAALPRSNDQLHFSSRFQCYKENLARRSVRGVLQ